MNTAYNIELSCNLISKNMKIFNIYGIEPKKDENTLEIINKNEKDQIISKCAVEVICCRVSPLKNLIKKDEKFQPKF